MVKNTPVPIFLSLKNANSYHGNVNISKWSRVPTGHASDLKSALSNYPESMEIAVEPQL